MLSGIDDAEAVADAIVTELGDHALTKAHARHSSLKRCKEIGLNVSALEDDQALQEAVLSVHHACIHTLASTSAFKIIENQHGVASVSVAHQVMVQSPVQGPDVGVE